MPAIYRQIQIKVIPQGAAADRPIGEMRQALTLFLSAVSRDLEGKLKRSNADKNRPADPGRAGLWLPRHAGDADGILYFRMRDEQPCQQRVMDRAQRCYPLYLALSLKAAKLRVGLIIGEDSKRSDSRSSLTKLGKRSVFRASILPSWDSQKTRSF